MSKTKEELMKEIEALEGAGQHELALKLIDEEYPIKPGLALAAKKIYGIEALKGFNLSEAINVYPNEFLSHLSY